MTKLNNASDCHTTHLGSINKGLDANRTALCAFDNTEVHVDEFLNASFNTVV
jgi:hypothetical protein